MRHARHTLYLIAAFTACAGSFAAAGAAAEPGPAAAQLPRAMQYGVWRGTIGRQRVMAMLEPAGCASSYYYLRHLSNISLAESGESAQAWTESVDGKTATWRFKSGAADRLDGEWIDSSGKRRVPIHLDRAVASNPGPQRCAQDGEAFEAPRAVGKEAVAEAKFGTHRYREISVQDHAITAIEVPEGEYRLPNLNKAMREWLKAQADESAGCKENAGDTGADYSAGMQPTVWEGQLLVLTETYSSYCGGAHPDAGVAGYLTWNLKTDQKMEPWTWISGGPSALPGKLKALIVARSDRIGPQGDCADMADMADYSMHPSPAGMVFHTQLPHVAAACEEDIEIPWAELKPFLTPEGKKAANALMQPKGGR